MHRDKRLGLAMGMLIVAIVGAFFFRVKPTSHDGIPELAQQQKIDHIISEMPAGPYLAGLDDDTSPIQQGQKHQGVKHRFSQNLPDWNQLEMQGNQDQLASNKNRPLPEQRLNNPSPDPIKSSRKTHAFSVSQQRIKNKTNRPPKEITNEQEKSEEFQLPPIEVSQEKHLFLPQNDTFKADSLPGNQQQVARLKVRPYRVKKGDTLERLAEKFLGDKNRYQEIYRLNQTKLRSADDLRAGMLIRLPLFPRISTRQLETMQPDQTPTANTLPARKNYHLTVVPEEKQITTKPILPPKRIPQTGKKPTPIKQWPFGNR